MPAWFWLLLAVPAVRCQPYPGTNGLPLNCPAGSYYAKFTGLPYYYCAACSSCGAGQYITGACGGLSNVQCAACPVCAAGLYASTPCSGSQPTVCTACMICYPGTYQARDCQAGGDQTQNRLCLVCLNNQYSTTTNAPGCNACIAGYTRIGGVCSRCATEAAYMAECASMHSYIQCDGVNNFACVPCTGSGRNNKPFCGVGLEASKSCNTYLYDGGQGVDAVCKPCEPGYANPTGAQFCSPCPTGFFANTYGSKDCTPCQNKPLRNSSYVAWGGQAASVPDCPWACNSGFYVAGAGGCAPCSSLADPGGGQVWVPWPAPTNLSQCQLVCAAGRYRLSGSARCEVCPAGMYKPAIGNDPCTMCTNAVGPNKRYLINAVFNATTNACPW